MGCFKLTYNHYLTIEKPVCNSFHLGNVHVVVSDKKLALDSNNDGIIDGYISNLVAAYDYFAHGALRQNRVYNASIYRYGFNKGSEKDDEINGEGNLYTTHFRELDTRLGRWWSIDPKASEQAWQSPYCVMDNNPIWLNDVLGDVANGNGKNKQPTYTVHSGDNLTNIAKKYHTTVEQIAKWNNIKDPDKIKVGQVLKVGPAPTQNSKQNQKPKPTITTKNQTITAEVETKNGGVQLSSTNTISKGSSNLTITSNVKTKKIASTSIQISKNTKLSMSTSGDITFGNNYYQMGNTKNGSVIVNINIPTSFSNESPSTYNMKITLNPEPFERLGQILVQDVDYLFKCLNNTNSTNGLALPTWMYAIP